MDNEFEPLKPLMSDFCIMNTTAKGEHVGEIERFIQTIKGKCRCISSEMREIGITHLPIPMIGFVVMWQNALRSKSGVLENWCLTRLQKAYESKIRFLL